MEPKYATPLDALNALANLSRMLELARGCHARLEAAYADVDRLVAKLAADRKTALDVINVLTESAPALCGIAISEYVERAGVSMQSEMTKIEMATVIAKCGGLP
jgi:hypothetical protein